MTARRPDSRRTAGFIMIYALGILIFITVIALSLAYVLRLNAKLVSHEKTALKTELALRGALHYTLAQLARARALQTGQDQPRLAKGDVLWSEAGGPYRLALEDMQVGIEFSKVNPDINLASREVLARLFLYIGARDLGEAQAYADIVLAVRDKDKGQTAAPGGAPPPADAPAIPGNAPPNPAPAPARQARPPGFSRIEEVLALEAIPPELRNGSPAVKNEAGAVVEPAKPGLAQLFSVATGASKLDANRSDLALVAAYSNAPLEKLLAFDRARRQKTMTPDEAVVMLGEGAKELFAAPNAAATHLRLYVETPPYVGSAEAVINLAAPPGPGQIVNFKLQPPGSVQRAARLDGASPDTALSSAR